MEEIKDQLSLLVGKEDAEKILKMQSKCDKYLMKFKKDMNKLLKQHSLQVLCGTVYKKIEE